MIEKLGEAERQTNETELAIPADIAWAPIRIDYEARGLTLNAVSEKHGVPLDRLQDHARKAKWQRDDSDVTDRRILINQLLALLERQIKQVNDEMKTTGEKEVAVLNKLATSLEKLIAMDKAEASQKAGGTETREMADIRIKLAKRINALTKG